MNEKLIFANELVTVNANLYERRLGIVETAVDLYKRGLNVFPLPSALEWQILSASKENQKTKKSPYFSQHQLFYSRLHNCDQNCIRMQKTGSPCLPESESLENLFLGANLGCIMGRTSGNLLAIDCDTMDSFHVIENELYKRNLPNWCYKTSRGGHYLMRLREGEASNLNKGQCNFDDVEIMGNRKYVVLPPSIHPSGEFYQWVTQEPFFLASDKKVPCVNLEDLSFLNVTLAISKRNKWVAPELSGLPEWTVKLSKRNREFLIAGTEDGERNYRLTCAAYDMAGNDIDYCEAEPVLLEAAKKCNPPYSEHDTSDILKCAYIDTREPARKSDLHQRKPHELALLFVENYEWRIMGRKAQKIRAVFIACIARSYMDDNEIFRASQREIAELANMDRRTAGDVLRCLSGRDDKDRSTPNLLVYIGKDKTSKAYKYKFNNQYLINILKNNTDIPHYSNLAVGGGANMRETLQKLLPTTPAEKDVFSVFGMVAWQVWKLLLEIHQASTSEIARRLRIQKYSIRRALRRLKKYHLVVYRKSEGLYYGHSKNEEELENLSVVLGVHGKNHQREQHHQWEREIKINREFAVVRKQLSERCRAAKSVFN